jgi:hypothetical protein
MNKRLWAVLLAIGCGGSKSSNNPDGSIANRPDSGPRPDADTTTGGLSHDLGACSGRFGPPVTGSPDDYTYWFQDITNTTTYPVDSNNSAYLSSMSASGTNLHPDFGSDPTYGIPFDTVPGSTPHVTMNFDTPDESDPAPGDPAGTFRYPYPADVAVEAGNDGHVLVIDRDNCILYETGNSVYDSSTNTWSGFSGAVFDFSNPALRPETWTSSDASGGPIFIGLVRYEEVAAGLIPHAIRFTANTTQTAYVHPATHQAGGTSSSGAPPMGARMRLKASACPGYLAGASSSPESAVIIQALCTYGAILADNGSDFYITGSTDPRWDDNDLNYLKGIAGSDFEFIQNPPLH